MEDTKAIRREVGPMEWLDDDRDHASALQANVGPPSSGHSISPPILVTYVGYFRHRAEEYGDLAAEMMAEGLDGTAYGAAKTAAHFGRIANDLYAQRAKELIAAHPEWMIPKHASNFLLVVALALLVGCGSVPTGPDSGDPREDHILAETARFASMLRVKVRGVVTDEVYLVPPSVPAYPGELVPAAGWYRDGVARYYRRQVLKQSLEYGSALAAHEVAHALFHDEAGASGCASMLLGGQPCR